MTTTTMTTTDAPTRVRRMTSSITLRLLGGYVLILALATGASILLEREVLLARLDRRIDAELTQEAQELRRLARGNDPETGRPFRGDVRAIFDVFLRRNIPSANETMITFVDGAPYLRSRRDPPLRLDRDERLAARWSRIETSERGRTQTAAGRVEYLAVPLLAGERSRGVFVVAIFRDREAAEVDAVIGVSTGASAGMLLVGALLAVGVARRIIGPVNLVTNAARNISESDLTRRIPVNGNDEIARLARTFNEMLDRLETAFLTQRRFVDDAGHELRTPITIVRGHLEVMGDDPAERRETIALVLDELDRMNRIVDELLVLAKAEQQDFLRSEVVDLEALTNEVLSKAQALADRRWRLESTGTGRIVGDRQRLTQALMQLAQNASQHTSEGDVILLGSSLEHGVARLWVTDTGPGIDPDDHERIFQRFARGRNGKRRSEGAGLGLSIVQAIAESHGGRVELWSRPGSGSTFTIVIPADPQENELREGVRI
ncbi:MAG TPA: ATP-binding protein [Actinomycetota bacterium]|nr:ATP-binding protein [Actinomycetota bacterium]